MNAQIITKKPFKAKKGYKTSGLYVSFFSRKPTKDCQEAVLAIESGDDEIEFFGDCAYLYCPNGYGRTKLSNNVLERKLKLEATTRNWKTINKLFEMANSSESMA